MTIDNAELERVVDAILPGIIDLRRSLHRHPELSYHEYETTARIGSELDASDIVNHTRPDGTGLWADLGGAGTRVGFRADLDALPINEAPHADYVSQVPGVMHACGHDVHAAVGVGIARVLASLDDLPGSVRLIFQHAEESLPGGALDIIEEGIHDGIEAIIAFHVDPHLEPGRVGLRIGPITASSDLVQVTVEGPGGHTARPHETVDTIYAAGRIATEVPGLLGRLIDTRKPHTLVFGQIHGGTADNVIPDRVEMTGTCRLLDRQLWDEIPELVDRLVAEVAAPTGAKVITTYTRGIPPVVNHSAVIAEVEFAVAHTMGTEAVADTHASLGAEDFAHYLDHIPGALIRIGAARTDRGTDLHSGSFDIDERAIRVALIAGASSLIRLMQCEWS